MNKNTEATANAYREFNNLNKQTKDETLPGLAGLTGGFNSLAGSSNAAAAGIKAVAAAQSALQREQAALQAGGALPSKISPDLKNFYRSELGLIRDFGGFIEGINLLPTDPFFGFGKGGNVGQAIQQRQSGSATATGGTVINITGTVIDPEGAARAIQDIIQNSGGRGGEISLLPGGLGIK